MQTGTRGARTRRGVAVLAAVAMLAACGGDDDEPAAAGNAVTPAHHPIHP